jgi:methyl-accepting chemotaxis protein
MWLDDKRIRFKLGLIVAAASLGMLLLFGSALKVLDTEVLAGRQVKVQDLVHTVHGILVRYEAEAKAGRLSEDDAKAAALADIKALRYGAGDYYWVHDLKARMVMHPTRPELDGKDVSDSKSSGGEPIFVRMNEVVTSSGGEGFYAYDWPKPGSDKPVRKLSYVKSFAPWGWVVGTGIYIDDVDAIFWSRATVLGMGLVVAVAVVLGLSLLVAGRITRPMATLSGVMDALARHDLATEVPDTVRKDEIGEMARAVQVFKEGLIRAEDLAEQQRQGEWAKDKRARVIDNLLKTFNEEVTEALTSVTGAARELEATSQSMTATAELSSRQASAVASAIEETAVNMRVVAASADQLSASGQQISARVSESVRISENASSVAGHTTQLVNGLSEAVGKIGEVVNLITDIASQTNLLALNATIEAARAGDAGKGFAVVANEVKGLANQTARATEEIASQIANVQSVTGEAVTAIASITGVIGEIGQISSVIAQAVSEQDQATGEIAMTVKQVADATGEVSSNILGVHQAADETGAAAGQVLGTAREMAVRAEALRDRVDTFLTSIRAS